jgi:hypothetical protein
MPKRWPKIEFIPFTEYRSGLEWGWKIVDRVFRVVEMLLVFGLVNYIRAKTHDWSLVFLEIILALAAILYLLFFLSRFKVVVTPDANSSLIVLGAVKFGAHAVGLATVFLTIWIAVHLFNAIEILVSSK